MRVAALWAILGAGRAFQAPLSGMMGGKFGASLHRASGASDHRQKLPAWRSHSDGAGEPGAKAAA